MRRPKQKLQVNTFPFLAVLLCAMGSLILLLLVMDRRAKIVARNKVLQEVAARQSARQADNADRLASAEAERQAEWERQRDNLHQILLRQQRELREHLSGLGAELTKADQHVAQHQDKHQFLYQQYLQEHQRLLQAKKDLDERRVGFTVQDKQEAAARTELERLTAELVLLEKTLRDLKDLKSRPSEAYSLVPYRGRNGDNRQPLYIECTLSGLVIHPGGTTLDSATLTTLQVREEVARRAGALMRQSLADAPRRHLPRNQNAYVLFLVRPDGIENFYTAQAALKGYNIDYGYELVEAWWSFDFSGGQFASRQPFRQDGVPGTAGSRIVKGTTVGLGPRGTGVHGGPADFDGPPNLGGPPGYNGNSPRLGESVPSLAGQSPQAGVDAATGPFQPGTGSQPVSRPTPFSSGSGTSPGTGSVLAPPSSVTGLPAGVPPSGNATTGSPPATSLLTDPAGKSGIGIPRVIGSSSGGGERSADSSQPPSGPPSIFAKVLPLTGLNLTGLPEQTAPQTFRAFRADNQPPNGPAGDPSGNTGSAAAGPSPAPAGRAQGTSAGPRVQLSMGSPFGVPGQMGGGQEGGTEGAGSEGSQEGSDQPAQKKAGKIIPPAPGAKPGSSGPRGTGLWLSGSSSPDGKAAAPTLGRLLSNHDYIITLECLAEGVVLYPRDELYPMNPAANQRNVELALVQAIQQMIVRRQATVRAGETPYRPMIRLQVQPEGRRTYYWIYPVLEGLRVPLMRENLEE